MSELGPVPAPRLPALENVGFVRIKDTATIRRSAALRKGFCDQKPMHRPARHLQAAGDLSLGDRLLVERADSFIACRAIGATDPRWSFFWQCRSRARGGGSQMRRHLPKRLRVRVCFG